MNPVKEFLQSNDNLQNLLLWNDEDVLKLVKAGTLVIKRNREELPEREGRAWILSPGQLAYGSDEFQNERWLTAEEAAKEFQVGVREIEERYRPEILKGSTEDVLEPLTECEYSYDFEDQNFDWAGYEDLEESKESVGYGESFDCYPEMEKGFVPDPDEDSDALMLMSHHEWGYDKKLEPKNRTTTKEIAPRVYAFSALDAVRERKMRSRKIKPIPPRGARGRFVKKTV